MSESERLWGATPKRTIEVGSDGQTWEDLRDLFNPDDLVWELMDEVESLREENERLREITNRSARWSEIWGDDEGGKY